MSSPTRIMGQGDSGHQDQESEARINLALLEPQRWGWTAAGGIADLLPPHERARRQSSKTAFLRSRRKRDRSETTACTTATTTVSTTLETPATCASVATAVITAAPPPLNGVVINGVGGVDNSNSCDNNNGAPPPLKRAAITTEKGTSSSSAAAATVVTTEKDPTKGLEEQDEKTVEQSTTITSTNGGLLLFDSNNNKNNITPSSDHDHANNNNSGISLLADVAAATTAPTLVVATMNNNNEGTNTNTNNRSSRNSKTAPSRWKNNDSNKSGEYYFRALHDDDEKKETLLDIYTYHRGREGSELRDEETGNLLCDVPEPTDTNNINVGASSIGCCNEQGPKLVANVTIRIPIVQNNNKNNRSGIPTSEATAEFDHNHDDHEEPQYFWETIKWDLADSDTASPMTFATHIAENFGLSFIETLQVAESIQQQLRAFCAEHAGYTVPVSYIDPSTERKRDVTSNNPVLTELYGQIIGHAEGGLERCKTKERTPLLATAPPPTGPTVPPQQPSEARRNSISNNSNCSSQGAAAGSKAIKSGKMGKGGGHMGKAPPKRSSTSGKMSTAAAKKSHRTTTTAISTCRGEVQKRLCLASANAITRDNNNNRKAAAAATATSLSLSSDEAATAATTRTTSTGLGQITMAQNLCCHICCQVQQRVGIFACGIENHAYCVNHIEELLGLSTGNVYHPNNGGGVAATTTTSEEPLVWDHCPICALACPCEACVPKLEGLTLEFQSRCMAQQCSPEMAEFNELFEYSKTYQAPDIDISTMMMMTTMAVEEVAPKKAPRQGKVRRQPERIKVAKLSALQFPREVSEGIDYDPGTPLDYAATYSEKGRELPDEALESTSLRIPLPFAGSGNSDVEDGSTDYCFICMGPGDLLCCDYCPRAFHSACINQTNAEEKSDDPWRCPRCCLENEGLPEDKLDGSKSLSLICAACESFGINVSPHDSDMLRLLSIIHEMLLRLMDYDFGYTFREPVDLSRCPGYSETVKRPMDLGTIATNLINAVYHNKTKVQSLEDIALDVLKDIELVWQNCFAFNFEGSAVYRMAEVQRRRAQAIRHESFEDLLTDRMKRELAEYMLSSVQSGRNNMNNGRIPGLGSGAMGPALVPTSSKSRNKIAVSHKRGCHQARVIAVLDPDTRRVVKMYSTVTSAWAAAKFLLQLDHPCEFPALPADTVQKVRKIIKTSAKDPTLLLFGHRWLHMEDLINGKVKFPKRQQEQQQAHQSETTAPPSASLDTGMDDELTLAQFHASNSSLFASASEKLPDMAVVVKADLISGKRVACFASVDAAFEDWLQTCSQSSLGDYAVSRTIEIFLSRYLDGSRNIDGIVWRSVQATKSLDGNMMDPEASKDSPQAESSTATDVPGQEGSETNRAAIRDLANQQYAQPTMPNSIPESQDEIVESPSFANTNKSNATAINSEHRKEALFDVSLRIGAMQNGTTNPLIRENKRARHDDPVTA